MVVSDFRSLRGDIAFRPLLARQSPAAKIPFQTRIGQADRKCARGLTSSLRPFLRAKSKIRSKLDAAGRQSQTFRGRPLPPLMLFLVTQQPIVLRSQAAEVAMKNALVDLVIYIVMIGLVCGLLIWWLDRPGPGSPNDFTASRASRSSWLLSP